MAFQKAVATAVQLRVLLIGGAKEGKTRSMLSFPGKKLVIDTEGRADAYADRFEFDVDVTKDTKVIKDDIRAVRTGRVPCDMLGLDGLSVFYDVLQAAAMSSDGEIKMQQWGGIKRVMSSVLDEAYHRLPCTFVATSRVKPKMVVDANKKANTSEYLVDGDVIDMDRKAAYLFDLTFRIKFDVQSRKRTALCMGSVYDEIPVGKEWTIPDGGSFYDIVLKEFVDSKKHLPQRVAAGQTDEEAAKANRSQFTPPPTVDDLKKLCDRIGIKWTLDFATEHVIVVDRDANPPILPFAERDPKRLYDDELYRARDVLQKMVDEKEGTTEDVNAELDAAAGERDMFVATDEKAPVVSDGDEKIKPKTRSALMAMLAERGIKDRGDRLEFAFANGCEVESFNDLYEKQAIYLCRMAEKIKKVEA